MMAPETIASSDTIGAKVEIFIGVGDAGWPTRLPWLTFTTGELEVVTAVYNMQIT